MIYGLRRMIYLLRKHDIRTCPAGRTLLLAMLVIISVPFIREAYIICAADIIASAISSVTVRNGYH